MQVQENIIRGKGQRKEYLKKPLEECTRQQQLTRKKKMVEDVKDCLSAEGYHPLSIEVTSKAGHCEVFNLTSTRPLSGTHTNFEKLRSSLYVKDKFGVSFEAFHELSMLSDLPSSSQVRKLTTSLNSQFNIKNTPNNITGVQQSIKERIEHRIKYLIQQNSLVGKPAPSTIRIKLTGDGTQIGRGLKVVNIAFTVIDEGERANSVLGNYTIAILKVEENYEQLAAGLQDIISDAKDCNAIVIDGQQYNIEYYLGGDLKFLAIVCGLEAANAEYACIWCKCPKGKRDDMTMEWSLTDSSKEARTIEEIATKSTLGKRNAERYNCCHIPLFPFIPIERVIIDTLHLFLRISDNLTDLLIRDLKAQDDLDKKSRIKHNTTNLEMYETHLNETWFEDMKELKYRDLTGPEKIRLFKNTDLRQQFPRLPNNDKIHQLWSNFFTIINDINKESNDYVEINIKTKAWVNDFTSIYQAKDVTPYICNAHP